MDGVPEPDTGVTVLKSKMALPLGGRTNSSRLKAGDGELLQRPHTARLHTRLLHCGVAARQTQLAPLP